VDRGSLRDGGGGGVGDGPAAAAFGAAVFVGEGDVAVAGPR